MFGIDMKHRGWVAILTSDVPSVWQEQDATCVQMVHAVQMQQGTREEFAGLQPMVWQ